MHTLCKTILIFWLLLLAKASLHPTKPIRNSTYIAGQAALVTWVEDGTKPLLASLGMLRIDLYAGRNTLLANVAKDIDPLSLSTTIFIPSAIPPHYYHFNLRFKAASPAISPVTLSRPLPRPRLRTPSMIVFTPDFSITPNPLSVQSIFPLQTFTTGTIHSTTSSSLPTPIITPGSRLAPSPTAGTADKSKSGAVGLRGRVMRMGIGVELEIKFRISSIILPALIGLSMTI